MKTVAQVITEYRNQLDANVTPIHGFKVGDKVETTPEYTKVFGYFNGVIVCIRGSLVEFELSEIGTYNFKVLNEKGLMPLGTVPKKVD